MNENFHKLFNLMHPDFFNAPDIRSMPEDYVFTEMVMDLQKETPAALPTTTPKNISFGLYNGSLEKLHNAVALVDDDWVQFFSDKTKVFCAFDGDTIAAFCILSDWGNFEGLKIGGPGCVGTIPEFRCRGIGLEMVRQATTILRNEGFDLSWIHYTYLEEWYSKIGYHTVLKWNCKGFIL